MNEISILRQLEKKAEVARVIGREFIIPLGKQITRNIK